MPWCESLFIALLRYRLWDIDIIINRTLVYGALTGTLALVYFILIIALQFLVRSLTGQVLQPPLVIVASTLAVAQETMQPTHVSLWLPPPAYAGKQRAPWRANPPVSSEGK